mgnify:CR=1 FL=1
MDYEFLTKDITSYIEGHMLPEGDTIDSFTKIYDIVQPKKIFEIGFNAGHSAFMSLELLPDVIYRSVDICRHKYTDVNAEMLTNMYPERFAFQKADSKKINASTLKGYDLIFIDGDHSVEGISSDLMLAKNAQVEYILVDDYHPKWFQCIIDLVEHFLAKPDFGYEKVDTFDYTSRDGHNTAILLKRKV